MDRRARCRPLPDGALSPASAALVDWVELRTEDGGLDESFVGEVRVAKELLSPPPPDTLFDRVADLEADFDFTQLAGDLQRTADDRWRVERAYLHGRLSPFGSAVSLQPSLAPRNPPALSPGATFVSPGEDPILAWPNAEACPEYLEAQSLGAGPEMTALRAAVDGLNAADIHVRDADQPDAEPLGALSLAIEQPDTLCGFNMPAAARLQAPAMGLDLSLALAVENLSFHGETSVGTNYEVVHVFTPAVFAERIGSLGMDLSAYRFVGVELWLQWLDAAPKGELRVVAWTGDDCHQCQAGACHECSEAQKIAARTLSLEPLAD